ncbi:hypothetical protein D8674_014992 [Pyrus ussuriensis x Pyrus communis]|uniref:Uncharacterized protein n=1 Tax=Pyrus ussuriensis x Pyrus communis TaxID=2448454 RepID=A0A5N5GX32_9ROSA|nr:hypothetical protein D8674_014992 [Pyrus ussuriensis x Pyrus communis]
MAKRNGALHLNAMVYHLSEEFGEEPLPPEWYQKAFPKLTKLTQLLKNVDLIDGRLVNISDGSIIIDDRVEQRMLTFKSPATVFIGAPLRLPKSICILLIPTDQYWQSQGRSESAGPRKIGRSMRYVFVQDKALDALAIEDKKRQYAAAENYLEDVLHSALATSE